MVSLPVPFIVVFLLLLIAETNRRQLQQTPTGKFFLSVICVYALSMLLIGLRWSLDLVALLPLAATLSVIGTTLLYLAFRSLGKADPVFSMPRDAWHLLPAVLVALGALLSPAWTDILLITTKLLYAGLLAALARRAPDSLQLVRLSWLRNTQRAIWAAVVFLLISTAIDIAIPLDFAFYDGRHAASIVGSVNLLILLFMGWIAVAGGYGRVLDTPVETSAEVMAREKEDVTDASSSDYASLVARLSKMLIDDRMYADSELNLQKLARKSGIPARNISRAINAHTGQNMSQWVNAARIDAVCSQLKNSEMTVSQAMQEAGFLTKSNFNREFRRIKGCSPSEWRTRNTD